MPSPLLHDWRAVRTVAPRTSVADLSWRPGNPGAPLHGFPPGQVEDGLDWFPPPSGATFEIRDAPVGDGGASREGVSPPGIEVGPPRRGGAVRWAGSKLKG